MRHVPSGVSKSSCDCDFHWVCRLSDLPISASRRLRSLRGACYTVQWFAVLASHDSRHCGRIAREPSSTHTWSVHPGPRTRTFCPSSASQLASGFARRFGINTKRAVVLAARQRATATWFLKSSCFERGLHWPSETRSPAKGGTTVVSCVTPIFRSRQFSADSPGHVTDRGSMRLPSAPGAEAERTCHAYSCSSGASM